MSLYKYVMPRHSDLFSLRIPDCACWVTEFNTTVCSTRARKWRYLTSPDSKIHNCQVQSQNSTHFRKNFIFHLLSILNDENIKKILFIIQQKYNTYVHIFIFGMVNRRPYRYERDRRCLRDCHLKNGFWQLE